MQWYASYLEIISGRHRLWWAHLVRGMLWLTTWPYQVGARIKNAFYDRGWKQPQTVQLPVVSVGNLTTGGTGKTPLVHWLAEYLIRRGLRPAVVSRGYGGSEKKANDESAELLQRFPEIVCKQNPDRVAACEEAIRSGAVQVLIADDGFQHRRLHRDLNLLLIDATQPWGFGYCLPRGLLREPLTGMRRADAFVITRAESASQSQLQSITDVITKISPGKPIAIAATKAQGWINRAGEQIPLEQLSGRRILAFAGIGNPLSFRSNLQQLSLNLVEFQTFPDHHPYQLTDFQRLELLAQQSEAEVLVCTRKDLVKLDRWNAPSPLWALEIGIELVAGAEALSAAIDRAVGIAGGLAVALAERDLQPDHQ